MPFKSMAQAKYAFATHQPWANEWADKTDWLVEKGGSKNGRKRFKNSKQRTR
jgi:hypothetical protein